MDNQTLQLNMISPEKSIFSGRVLSVVFPGTSGFFGIYPGHAPIVSPLKKGKIVYKADGGDFELEIDGGIVEVASGIATACIETAVTK